ncbi:MAG: class I adenylate-forming enzyme family protein [Steroidobacteraceae bacterium]
MKHRTIGEGLRLAVQANPQGEAILIGRQRLSFAELRTRAAEVAAGLRRLGVQPGDHVGILMPNNLEYLLLFHGCALLGAAAVHFNSRYRREELRYVIQDSGIKRLFTSAMQREFADYEVMLKDIYPALADWNGSDRLALSEAPALEAIHLLHGPTQHAWPGWEALAGAGQLPENEFCADPERIALIMYTSGTTAQPKACLLSHRALEFCGQGLAERWQMGPADRFWDPLPFFHMSTILPLAACRASGAAFIGQEHFDAGESVREIAEEGATILFPSFPTLTNALFTHPEYAPEKFASVRIVNNVGPADLLRRFADALPAASHVSAYGLTEAGGVIAFNHPDDTLEQRTTTSGQVFDGVEVKVVDPDTLEDKPAGEVGEILIRGPSMFSGYLNAPEKTAEVTAPGGWLRSGDLGALVEGGRIRYVGRLKDMLKVGGENVAAIEIEGQLCQHPSIRMAQVVSAPDERLVEVPAAFIELEPGASLEREAVVEFLRGRIASFKIPRYVAFVTEWPMSATKIQKFKLRAMIDPADRIEIQRKP